jgi:hypothetical protein
MAKNYQGLQTTSKDGLIAFDSCSTNFNGCFIASDGGPMKFDSGLSASRRTSTI